MVWAPDSPDLWAPDSATPNRWAPDSGGHLTLGRAVDLFLAAKAAEGAAAKTLERYGMILRRAVRGLRVSEAAGLRLGDLRPDGTLKVLGKGAKERIVPVGGTARTAIVRYMGQRGAGAPDEPLFLGRRGALDWRGMQQVLKRLKGRAGPGSRAMQPALAPPHIRPELPRQRRRRVQPPADPRPHDRSTW
jgi:integrase